jgi:hypothetical protein
MKLVAIAVALASSPAIAEPVTYVEGGAAAGITGDKHEAGAFLAGAVDGGYRLGASPIWAHGAVVAGALNEFDTDGMGKGSYLSARVGFEVRRCIVAEACGAAGVDFGGRYQLDQTSAFVAPRIEGDFGGTAIRIRPGGQLSIGANGLDGFALTLGVAYVR